MSNMINSLGNTGYISSQQAVNQKAVNQKASPESVKEKDSFSSSEQLAALPKMPKSFKSDKAPKAPRADAVKITIISTNDMHGEFEAMPKLAAVIKDLQQKHPDAILVDGGDSSYNPPFSKANKYQPTTQILDAINYDFINLGNHEFQSGRKQDTYTDFVSQVADEDTTVLSANVHDKVVTDSLPGVEQYVIREIDGLKVAFVGLVEPNMGTSANPQVGKDLKKESTQEAMHRLMPELQKKADVIIALSHQGIGDDQRLAKAVQGIDLILASHDHAVTNSPISAGSFPNRTYIVEGGSHCRLVSLVELSVDPESKKVLDVELTNYPVASYKVKPDENVAKIIDNYQAK